MNFELKEMFKKENDLNFVETLHVMSQKESIWIMNN